jgi:DNA helicase HerA-like ATPase
LDSSDREYICAVKTGSEFDDYIRYDSAEVLKSVVDRLENLNSIGIFRSQMPPFDPAAPVWRYHLKALSMEERKLFVLFRLEEIFMAALQRGEQQQIRDIVILDEAHAFHDDDAENIINTIAREARKFGLGMIAASQSPTHFTEDFLTSVGTKVCLAIDEMFWDGAARKLRLDVKALEWIKPRRTCAVQIKATTESKNAWRWVVLPQTQMKSRELESA